MNNQEPPGSSCVPARSVSTPRNRRRTRLRTTAGPTARGTAKATRGGMTAPPALFCGVSTVSWRYTTVTGPDTRRRPRRWRAAKVARSRTRWIRPIAGPDRAGAGPGGCGGRPWSTCGGGTRGVGPDGGCWVGRSSSRTSSSEATGPGCPAPGGWGTPGAARPPTRYSATRANTHCARRRNAPR